MFLTLIYLLPIRREVESRLKKYVSQLLKVVLLKQNTGKKNTLIAFVLSNKDLCHVLEFPDQSSLTASYVPFQQDESEPNYL